MKVMAVVEMKSLFSTQMLSMLETPSRNQSTHQDEVTEINYDMINVMEHFVTDFQEFKVTIAERINKIEYLLCENAMGHGTIKIGDMKQQVELLQHENSRLRIESKSLLKVIELLSVQQIKCS